MTDYKDIERILILNQLCESLGFRYDKDSYGHNFSGVALYAKEELVIYNEDMPLASGTVEDLLTFLYGWQKAHQYLMMLNATSDKIIERKKLDYRNKKLAHLIKNGKGVKSEAC